jgi:hypothetical protein
MGYGRGETEKEKVYVHEPNSLGSCHSEAGCVGLISSGTSEHESAFLAASASGKRRVPPHGRQSPAACESESKPCSNAGVGEIVASPLVGPIGYINKAAKSVGWTSPLKVEDWGHLGSPAHF